MAGLQNLSSLFKTENENQGVNYINDEHASGFTLNVQPGDPSLFLGIEGSTYNNPGDLGYDNDVVNFIEDNQADGFVPQLQAGDDTLFVGVVGENYNNPGINLGTFYVDDYEMDQHQVL